MTNWQQRVCEYNSNNGWCTTISETGTSDGIYLFTDASGGENIAAAHANSDLKFQLQRDDGSN